MRSEAHPGRLRGGLSRRFDVLVAMLLVGGAGLTIFLVAPLDGLNLHPAVLAVQQAALALFTQLWPFFAVATLGAAVGVAELSSTFSDYPKEAIVTRWGLGLIVLNALTAGVAFLVARTFYPDVNLLLLVIGVGVGFPTLIRTNFTFAKQLGGEGTPDSSVNAGWLYEQFQKLCKDQIDRELLTFQRAHVEMLLRRFPTVQELYNTALYVLRARATLTPEQETARLEELKRTIESNVPVELTRLTLGQFILEIGGVAFVDSITETTPVMAAPAAGGTEVSADEAMKQLRNLSLDELKTLALSALTAPEDQERVNALGQPVPGIPDVTQRASVARYLVDRVGAAKAQELAAGRG